MANMRITTDAESDAQLRASIALKGVEQSINVRPHPDPEKSAQGILQVYAGRRRTTTVKKLKSDGIGLGSILDGEEQIIVPWDEAPIRIPYKFKDVNDFEAYHATMDENIVRKTVSQKEIGNWLQLMALKFMCTQKELAVKLGKSESWVSRNINFFKKAQAEDLNFDNERQFRAFEALPDDVQQTIREEVLAGSSKIPSARGLQKLGLPPVSEVLLKYDSRQYRAGQLDKRFLATLLVEKGYDYLHAMEEVEKWGAPNTRGLTANLPGKKNAFTELQVHYPLNLIDSVADHHDSSHPETLRRYCRMVVGSVFEYVSANHPQEIEKIWQKILR